MGDESYVRIVAKAVRRDLGHIAMRMASEKAKPYLVIIMNGEEFQLLLCCARSKPDSGSIKERVNKGVNWRKLLDLAEHPVVRPMLRRSLKAVCWDCVPQDSQLELERFYTTNAQRSLLFVSELLRPFTEIARASIPVATFKGVTLAESIYGDLSLREFSDLD